jgi:hypothetical protein
MLATIDPDKYPKRNKEKNWSGGATEGISFVWMA